MKETKPQRLRQLDFSVVQQCMHCGLCLPSCPTYALTLEEQHSPRGRLALMRAIADGRLEPSTRFGEEMYFCLGCLACTTACPAGVQYARLFEEARATVEEAGVLRRPFRSLIRLFAIGWLFMDLRRLRALGRLMRLYQRTGLQALLRRTGMFRVLPARYRHLEAMTPEVQSRFSAELIPEVTPAIGTRRWRVALLIGCAQDLLFSDVNRDTAEVLAQNGCEVFTPSGQSCCGSLHAHNGEMALAIRLARRNLDQFPPETFDAIITNAGGCGSHLRHYATLLAEDPAYRARAAVWDSKVKDVHEWLIQCGLRRPRLPASPEVVVTYHDSCHLAHGQGITRQPRQLLQSIPNLRLVELRESTWCCGSAGVYNITQPETAEVLLERKIQHVRASGAEWVATANPGCLLQLMQGMKRAGIRIRVAHPVTLLAEAYRAERNPSPTTLHE